MNVGTVFGLYRNPAGIDGKNVLCKFDKEVPNEPGVFQGCVEAV
jgi:hypothetical protein